MITVISHLESLPQPYRGEAMLYRDSKADNMFTCTLGAALMLALPRGIIRDTILKAWNRGEFAAKHVGQPEARVDMAMPELNSTGASVWDIEIQLGVHYENASRTDSDQFTEQYASNGDSRTINHEAY